MTKTSLLLGLLLVALGAAFYFITGAQHLTALIPSVLGLCVVGCGLLAIRASLRKKAAHFGALFGLLGVGAGFGMAIPKFVAKDAGAPELEQFLMGVLCLVYLWFCIRSFIAAGREMRKAQALVGRK